MGSARRHHPRARLKPAPQGGPEAGGKGVDEPGLTVRYRLPPTVNGVALTFDDCDQGGPWSQILDVLAAENVAATFFANGMRVVQLPEPARRTVGEGHALGAHGWDHSDLTRLPSEEVERRLRADRRAWCDAGASDVVLFRPPYGRFSSGTLRAARRAGYREMVLWDVDPLDWQLPEPEDIVTRVVHGSSPGSIIDLHVTGPTAAALPGVIHGLRQHGLACVPLQGSWATPEIRDGPEMAAPPQ